MCVQLSRQLEVCQSKRQAVCVRYETVLEDWKGWLHALQQAYALPTKPGYPQQVSQPSASWTRGSFAG